MRNLSIFTFCFELLFASTALGTLFMADLPFLVKLFAAVSFLLFAGLLELQNFDRSLKVEALAGSLDIALRALESQVSTGSGTSIDAALAQHLRQVSLAQKMKGQGSTYAWVLSLKLALWVTCGAGMYTYVLPTLLQKHIGAA